MTSLQQFLKGAALTLFLALLVSAQTTPSAPAELSIIIGDNKVKFTPLRNYQELRLEIFNGVGELIYASGAVSEAELNWNLQDSNGQPLKPGLYAYTLSIKVPEAEAPRKHQGHFILEQSNERLWLTTKDADGIGTEVTGGQLTVARSPERTTAGAGYTASGRSLSERAGLQRDNKDRAVTDKKPEVTREGGGATLNISGSGTTNRHTKWLDGPNGVVGDSVIHETAAGDLGIGTASPGGVLDVVRSSPNPLIGRFWNTGTGPAQLRFVGGTGATSQFLITDTAEWLTSIAVSNSIGMQLRVRGVGTPNNEAELSNSARPTLLRNGDVGVGTTAPTHKLDVAGTINTTTQYNLGGARILSNAGTQNLFAGVGAGAVNTGGANNSFFGSEAGQANTTGAQNTFVGRMAGKANQTGRDNTFVGAFAGESNTTGSFNAIFGEDAGAANTTGSYNAIFGEEAGKANTSGNFNSFFGWRAGVRNTTGFYNTFIGRSAGEANVTGSYNSFFGYAAGTANTGSNNSFFGYNSGAASTTGGSNAFFGATAGYSNTTGSSNAFVGFGAGYSNTTGANNTFFGTNAGHANTTASNNAFFGSEAGTNTTGTANSFFGESAGKANTTGNSNTTIGSFADLSANNLNNATAIGHRALANCNSCIVLGSINGVNGAGATVNVGIGTTNPTTRLHVVGTARTQVLQIDGGSDFSENFDVSLPEAPGDEARLTPGLVVSIDPAQPGKLKLSRQAYDRRVAGIISGAGGIKTGMLMGQSGSVADGAHPVALSGRVYVWADAAAGAIQPGDLLTTSGTPGHAMKVRSHTKAQGAIIGKAMTSLKQGKGLVLVLVTLQ